MPSSWSNSGPISIPTCKMTLVHFMVSVVSEYLITECILRQFSNDLFFSFFSFESNESMVITCSTKVCSFGKQVVEKVETEYSRLENGRFVYRINRSPMCDYMINFINKLKRLPEKYMMNSVLENFTILQVCFIVFHLNLSLNEFCYFR